ncbi:MAG: hypothetical protein CUN55_09825, partial [Phototrophicales bacterium]
RSIIILAIILGLSIGNLAIFTSSYAEDEVPSIYFSDVWFNVETQVATLTIENHSDTDMVLSAYCSPAATEGVTLNVDGEAVDMLLIEANSTYDFVENNAAFTFEGLAQPLEQGDAVPLLLTFDHADDDMEHHAERMDDCYPYDQMGMDEMSDDMDGHMDDHMDEMHVHQQFLLGVPALEVAPPEVGVVVLSSWVRPQAPITAAYVTFYNPTDEDIVLVGVSSPVATVGEMHTVMMENDVMQMRPVEQFVIPAGEKFELMPGGNHFMLIDVTDPDQLAEGLAVPLVLVFEDGTELTIGVPVLSAPFGDDMGNMDNMDMEHGHDGDMGHSE